MGLLRRWLGKLAVHQASKAVDQFYRLTPHTPEVQRRLLLDKLARNADTDFGRDHHFGQIRTVEDFRRQVPIAKYEYYEPYIDRVRMGNPAAMFGRGQKLLMFAMTSGTTARPKYIPITCDALRHYREGWTIWGMQAFRAYPGMFTNGLAPILQLCSDWEESRTPSGVACGAISGLTAKVQHPAVRGVYCMPAITGKIKDAAAKYYTALRLAIPRPVGTILSANPSTLVTIAKLGDEYRETLIRDIAQGTLDGRFEVPAAVRAALRGRIERPNPVRARELEQIVERTGTLYPKDYWPSLAFLGNWTGGSVSGYLRHYPRYFGDLPIRDIGLIASEGRMSIPVEDRTPAGIADVMHHYFEFVPEDEIERPAPTVLEAHELEIGRNYYILLTTSGGLYRYNIYDIVRCVGYRDQAPIIEFLNKGAHISSITGEKVSEFQVTRAVEAALSDLSLTLTAYTLAPSWAEVPYYTLYIERDDLADPAQGLRLVQEIDARLQGLNLEYASKRQTRRLGPIRLRFLDGGTWRRYDAQRLARSGGTAEQYKHPCLITRLDFADQFPPVAEYSGAEHSASG